MKDKITREISGSEIQRLIDEAEMKKAKFQRLLANAFMVTVVVILFLMAFT